MTFEDGFLTCSAVNAVLNDNWSFNSNQPQGHCISFSTAFPPCPSGVKQQPLQWGRVFLSSTSKSPQTAELSEIHALSVSKKPVAVLFEYFQMFLQAQLLHTFETKVTNSSELPEI